MKTSIMAVRRQGLALPSSGHPAGPPPVESWVWAEGAVKGNSLAGEIHCAPYGGVSPSGMWAGLLCFSVSNRSEIRIAS